MGDPEQLRLRQDQLAALVRDWIAAQYRAGINYSKLAKQWDCSHAALSKIARRLERVGPKIQHAFAHELYDDSIDQMYRAAARFWEQLPPHLRLPALRAEGEPSSRKWQSDVSELKRK